jgi:hypothetical protein
MSESSMLTLVEKRLEELFGPPTLAKANAIGWRIGPDASVGVGREGSREAAGDVAFVWLPADVGPEWVSHQRYEAGDERANTIEELPLLNRSHAADRYTITTPEELNSLANHLIRHFPEAVRIWRIERDGSAWKRGEALDRYDLAPEKIEMCDGKLFLRDEQRLTMLALLLENVGIDNVVKLGPPELWREAIEKL